MGMLERITSGNTQPTTNTNNNTRVGSSSMYDRITSVKPQKQEKVSNTTGKENLFGTLVAGGVDVTSSVGSTIESKVDAAKYGSLNLLSPISWLVGKITGEEERAKQAGNLIKEGVAKKTAEDTVADYFDPLEKKLDPYAYEGFKSGQFGEQIIKGGSAVLTDAAISSVLPGMGQVPVIGKFGVPITAVASGYAQGTSEGIKKGLSFDEAQKYGIGSGALQGATEGMFSGIGGLVGKGPLDDILIDKLTGKITNNIIKNGAKLGIKVVGENVEETIAGIVDPMIRRATIDPNAKNYFEDEKGNFTLNKFGQDVLATSIITALVGVPGVVKDIRADNQTDKAKAITKALEQQTPTTQQNIPATTQTSLETPVNGKTEGFVSENVKKFIPNGVFPNKNIKVADDEMILYHGTKNENVDAIVKEGIKPGMKKGAYTVSPEEGNVVWATTEPGKGYGGNTIAFKVKKSDVQGYKVNDTMYTLPNSIEPQNILYVDKAIDGKFPMQVSDLIEQVKKFGKEKTIDVVNKTNGVDKSVLRELITTYEQQSQPMQKDVLPQEKQVIYEQEQAPYKETEILTKVEKAPIGDKLEAFKDGMQQAFINDMHYVYKVANELGDDRIIPLTNNAKQANASAQYAIEQEFRNLFGTSVEGKSLLKTFEGINQKGETYKKDVFTYLVNKHNIDRINADKPALVDVNGKIKTVEQSQKTVDNLLKKYPELENIANEIYQYEDNLLQVLKDGQILSDAQIANLKATYPFYVPLFRDVDTGLGVGAYGTAMGTQNPLKKAKGITLETNKAILPIDETMAAQTIKYFNAAKKNLMFKGILDAVRNNPQLASKYAVEIKDVEDIDIEQEITGENLDSTLKKEGKANTLTVYENGKKVKMEISKELYHSLLQMTNESLTKKFAKTPGFKQSAMAVKGFKTATTAADLTFTLITNPTKDIQNALMNTEDAKGYMQKFPEAIKKIAEGSEDWKQFLSMGSFQSGILNSDDFMYKGKALNVANKAFQAIEVIEQIPRFAEFLRIKYSNPALANDYNQLLKAMYGAAEVTINFGKGGEVTKFIDRYFVPYLNASVQGASKISQNLTGKRALRYVIKGALMGATPALINALMYNDDDEYKELNQYEKDNYYQIKVNGKFISIPKGQLNAATGTITNLLMDATSGEEITVVRLGEAFKNIAGQVGPTNPFDANIFSTFSQLNANESWAGSKIVPDRLKDKPAREQYDANTTSLAINIGNVLNVSPKKIDYFIAQYSGGLGKTVMPLMTETAEPGGLLSYPLKKFTTDPVFSNKNVGLFYDTYDKLLKEKNSDNATNEDYRNFKILSSKKPYIDELYSQIRKIQSSNISDEEKLKQVREKQIKINEIAKQAIINYKNNK